MSNTLPPPAGGVKGFSCPGADPGNPLSCMGFVLIVRNPDGSVTRYIGADDSAEEAELRAIVGDVTGGPASLEPDDEPDPPNVLRLPVGSRSNGRGR